MTTCTSKAYNGQQCPRTASSRTVLLHTHHGTALGPQIGTILQLGSSYAGRNNRNKISYENAFFSYVRVPIHRYECTPRYSAVPAQNSPAQLQMPPGTHSLPSLHRNNNPKLFQSWNRNNLRLLKGATTPESLPITYEFGDIARPSAGRIGTPIPSCCKAVIGTRKPCQNCHSPRTVPSQIRTARAVRPSYRQNRNTKPKLFQSYDRNNNCSPCSPVIVPRTN